MPKQVRLGAERVPFGSNADARFDVNDVRVAAEWERLKKRLARPTAGDKAGLTKLIVVESPDLGGRDAYRLELAPQRILLKGASPSACFYGLQTLAQLDDFHAGELPVGEIIDQPDFAARGLLHDVTRGKVPKLTTLKLLADRLARLKVNQLQLYIEHAFAFSFDPEICAPQEGLTPDEARELDCYCRERFIELVPAVATLGHMGRILSMPRYRSLAEIEPTQPWEEMTWLRRLKGATLDVLNPESRVLVARIWTDILAAFSSGVVNICGDEPWDLGKGKNSRLTPAEAAEAYVEHLRWTAEFCGRQGRICQIWSDVVRNHTDLLPRLPGNMAILHWGYDDRSDYDGTGAFTSAGYRTYVCPGTSGWKRVLNAMNLAERNIATFARAGAAHGAAGLVNTDWGDFGHFNQLACSWHAIALGAACAWDAAHEAGNRFDQNFARTFLRVPPALITHLREASAVANTCETWKALITPEGEIAKAVRLPARDALERTARAAADARRMLGGLKTGDEHVGQDCCELSTACRFTELVVEHLLEAIDSAPARSDRQDRLREAAAEYSRCWPARNKPGGLRDVLQALGVSS